MPEKFLKELDRLRGETVEMGHHARGMLEDSVRALRDQDTDLAQDVISRKNRLYDMDNHIEEHTLKVLTLHQPMARDMRTLATILKTITYLTRVGRYGYDIARVSLDTANQPHVAKLVKIPAMARMAGGMLEDAMRAFTGNDTSPLANFNERDDDLDQLRWSIFREAITYMMEDPRNITRCMHYVMIARYLERCGDHACKIAEKVVYMVDGERVEIS